MSHATNAAAAEPAEIPPGQIEHAGRRFMVCADGTWIPLERVDPADKLQDDFVREKVGRAQTFSSALADFKRSVLDDADVILELLASQYRVVKGGKKGNVLFETLDGTMRVQLAVAQRLAFGPRLEAARILIDELLLEWGEKSPPEMTALVTQAFRANKAGELSPGKLLGLRRIKSPDERWIRAMEAIADAVKPAGTARYVRFHVRPTPEDAWVAVPMALSDV